MPYFVAPRQAAGGAVRTVIRIRRIIAKHLTLTVCWPHLLVASCAGCKIRRQVTRLIVYHSVCSVDSVTDKELPCVCFESYCCGGPGLEPDCCWVLLETDGKFDTLLSGVILTSNRRT